MTGPLSRTALIAVTGVVAVSLAIAAALTVFGDDLGDKHSAGVDAYSVSAIGHRGLARLLDKLGVPVMVSRSDSSARARNGLLIVAEPVVTDDASRERLAGLVGGAQRVLVVLPKWYGSVERGQRWLADANPLPAAEIAAVLAVLDLEGAELRRAAVADPELSFGGVRPVIREPQLIASDKLTAMISNARGERLLGKVESDDAELYVLTDPDRALFEFPLVLATLQVLICAVLAVWAAMVRFGPLRDAPPPIAPGKDFLIRNTAALLHYGGHHADALRRYLALTVAAVRHALHAPALTAAPMTAWLERVRAARGGKISLVELERGVETADSPARVVELADQVYRWRMEMTHGTDDRP